MLNQLEPYETIARKVGCSVKAVKLRDKRLEADGSVEMKKGGRSKRLCQKRVQLSKRPRTPPKKKAKHSQVTPEEKGAIRYGVMHGDSNCTVAKAIGRDEATVRLWKDRLQATGKMERKTGSGRKRITTEREDRALVYNSLKDRRKPATELRDDVRSVKNDQVSVRTIRNRLTTGLPARRPLKSRSSARKMST